MSEALARLEPYSLWELFGKIAAIPRPSKHEERIVAWVRELAGEHGWSVRADEIGNLVLEVPATPGRERADIVILQSHLDMVCEKNKDVEHDFMTDPIRPRVEGDWVYATGTTLGADNGIGVAAALAIATDPSVVHGPLELLFTLDEETGLHGAQGLDASMLRGRTMLNMDSEEDGKLFVGCAGGADCRLWLEPARRPPAPGSRSLTIFVSGLRGGHSGLNIHENRGNAVKLLTRLLQAAAADGVEFEIAELHGGSKHNAIPREAEATLTHLDGEADKRLRGVVACMTECYRDELRGIDDQLQIRVAAASPVASVMQRSDWQRLLNLLAVLPHGVLGMSPAIPGLVETSNNLAAVEQENGGVRILTSCRSSVGSTQRAVLSSILAAGKLAGARTEEHGGYPGWKPNLDSAVLATTRRVYSELWGQEPEVTAIHAGLECGLLGQKIPGLDMISFGPQIEGAHSPDERAQISSVGRFWEALVRVLCELA